MSTSFCCSSVCLHCKCQVNLLSSPSFRRWLWQKQKGAALCFSGWSCRGLTFRWDLCLSQGQCPGSAAAESSRYSTFSSISLRVVRVCASLVTMSGTPALKCQKLMRETTGRCFYETLSLSLSSATSARLSAHIISSRDYSTRHWRAVPLVPPLQTTVIHLLCPLRALPPPTAAGVKACRDKDRQDERHMTKEPEASWWLSSSWIAFKAAVLNMDEAQNHSVANDRNLKERLKRATVRLRL